MKIVQTAISEAEHRLLEEYAKKNSKTIKEVLRQAIRRTVEQEVDPNDPIFTEPPLAKSRGRRDYGSETHDKFLYGDKT